MQMKPILSSLRHHKLTAILLSLQVALTCAIMINALFMVVGRVERVRIQSGVDEDRLSMITVSGVDSHANEQSQHAEDLAALNALPGVESAVLIGDGMPFAGGVNAYGICPTSAAWEKVLAARSFDHSNCTQPDVYNGSAGFVAALGLRVVAGRGFKAGDFVTGDVASALLTRSLASQLYPGQSAVGQTLYQGRYTIRVVGVVDDVLRPVLRGAGQDHRVMFWPQLPDGINTTYPLRSKPGDRQRVLREARAALMKADPHRLFPTSRQRTFSQMRRAYFERDTTMIGLLLASALGLLFVTALGIAGLANFWVQQRTRSIGIRRAIGATRGDILRYFQTENFLIVGGGIVLGMTMAVLLNLLLMRYYELPRLPLWYLPPGAAALWALGQVSVLAPALRASRVPPVVATRAV